MNLPPDANELPPPSAEEVAARQPNPKAAKRRRRQIIGLTVAVVVGIGVLTAVGEDDGDDGGKKMTLTEAACQILDDGEDAEFTYSVMKDLAADHPLTFGEDESVAARLAVNAAVAQGCG